MDMHTCSADRADERSALCCVLCNGMTAKEENSAEKWDALWSEEGDESWRKRAMAGVYERIAQLMPRGSKVIDLGGGRGFLAELLRDEAGCSVEVWEHNEAAVRACTEKGLRARFADLEDTTELVLPAGEAYVDGHAVVATEVLEHLSVKALHAVLSGARALDTPCFFSVPNDRLGPDEEPQHARKWTALEFKRHLQKYFKDVRVEVLGPKAAPRDQPAFLLAVCNMPKKTELSVCMPVRDEAADIESCLASFMGVADEMVIGVDPRTKDNTRGLAEKYADVVFELTELRGPPGEEVPEGGFHFAHARNQCMDRFTKKWIFMTEGHERLWKGGDTLLQLEETLAFNEAAHAKVVQVVRTGGPPIYRQMWMFPWLCLNRPDIRYRRSTHNTLTYPEDFLTVKLPQVHTLHERVHEREKSRQDQRKVQNRLELMEDWLAHGNEWSLHYLGAEWREWDSERAVRYLKEYLVVGKNGALRYHTRLVLAKQLVRAGRLAEAKEVLLAAPEDDWTRIEHWVFLGDIANQQENYEEAITYYEYAATKLGGPPFTTWWIDLAMYTWLPAQRLAQMYSMVGQFPKSLHWATIVRSEYEKAEAPAEMVAEADENIRILKEAIDGPAEAGRAA